MASQAHVTICPLQNRAFFIPTRFSFRTSGSSIFLGFRKIHNLIILGLFSLLLIGEWGCAHHVIAPSPLPESMQQQLGKIGVLVSSTGGQKTLGTPEAGRLSNIRRGAGLGAAMGAGGGAQGGPFAVIGIPAFAVLGLIGGAFYGAVASEPWEGPDATFRTIVAELNLNRALPEHLVVFSRMHGYEITHMSTGPPQEPQEPSRYAAARRDGIDTVLEIQDFTVNLIPAEYMVNPYRALILSARIQLIRTADAAVLDDRVVTDKLGPALVLNEWTADHAERFRQEVQQASERLAEQIVMDYFMVYPFFERVTPGSFLAVHLKGLRPLYPGEEPGLPAGQGIRDEDIRAKYSRGEFQDSVSWPIPNEFRIMAQRTDALQPTMSWEPFYGPHVTYDLKIWRSGRLGPDALVYNRTNLKEASHKLETALEPSSLYYWSVRAHFVEQGKDRITEWSRRSVKHSLMAKVMTSGIVVLMPDPVDEGFYVFITPQPASQGLQPAVTQSKWFPWGNWPLSAPDSDSKEQPIK